MNSSPKTRFHLDFFEFKLALGPQPPGYGSLKQAQILKSLPKRTKKAWISLQCSCGLGTRKLASTFVL